MKNKKTVMKNNFIHFLNRVAQRIAIKVIKMGDPNRVSMSHHTDYENECVSICRKLIPKDETVLLMSPISGKRYIKYDDGQIFIIIQQMEMTLVNHNYSYTIDIQGKAYERISKMFDNEIERRRQLMEDEIKSNVKHSLKTIYKNLVDEQV
jgi:hypothetical protein